MERFLNQSQPGWLTLLRRKERKDGQVRKSKSGCAQFASGSSRRGRNRYWQRRALRGGAAGQGRRAGKELWMFAPVGNDSTASIHTQIELHADRQIVRNER